MPALAKELLNPVDAAWFRMDQRQNQADIAAVLLLDGELDEAQFRRVLETRLLCHERFRKRAVDSVARVMPPRWEPEPGFSLDAHLERRDVPGGDEGLARFLGELLSVPLDLDRSPWRIVLLGGLTGGTGLFVRLHHCMGDGFALLEVLVSLADPSGDAAGTREAREANGQGNDRGMLDARKRFSRWLSDGAGLAAALGHVLRLPFDPPNALRGRLSGKRRVAWSEPIPLERAKALAHSRGATVNDVVLTALSGAFHRVLADHGRPPPNVRAIVPVNLRPKSEPVDLERGNWFGLVFVDLPTSAADPDVRFATLKRNIERIKRSKEAVVTLGILAVLGRVPGIVDRIAEEIFARKATAVVTNVPGPKQPLGLAGSQVRDLFFWVPHPCGLACGASVMSYAGHIRVGIRTDAAVIADPTRIARYFAEELAAEDVNPPDA